MSSKDPKVNLCYKHLPKGEARKVNQQLVEDVSLCSDPSHRA